MGLMPALLLLGVSSVKALKAHHSPQPEAHTPHVLGRAAIEAGTTFREIPGQEVVDVGWLCGTLSDVRVPQ